MTKKLLLILCGLSLIVVVGCDYLDEKKYHQIPKTKNVYCELICDNYSEYSTNTLQQCFFLYDVYNKNLTNCVFKILDIEEGTIEYY